MKTITIEQLAEKLNGKLWVKENIKRIYLDRGHNTKKMSTKTYVFEKDGEFLVSCFIDCPSQAIQWIKSQQKEIIDSVKENIEAAIEEFGVEVKSVEPEEKWISIHVDNLPGLVGKKIQWKALAYWMNKPYGGIAIINEIIEDKNPIKSTTVEGGNLDFAFVDYNKLIAYSDGDRFVTYKIIEDAAN